MPETTKTGCGHGHVFPMPNGSKARCGGPGLCRLCSLDAAEKVKEDSSK